MNDPTTWIFVGLLVVLVVVLLVVPMFTNKKRAKQTMELHNSLKPGDVIKTVGGIIGTVKSVKQISPNDREMVIETGDGDNKTTMTFDIQALYQVLSRAVSDSASAIGDSGASDSVFDEPVKADAAVDEKPADENTVVAASDKAAEPENDGAATAAVDDSAEKAEKADAVEAKTDDAVTETAATAEPTETVADASEKPEPAIEHKPIKRATSNKSASTKSASSNKTTAAKKTTTSAKSSTKK